MRVVPISTSWRICHAHDTEGLVARRRRARGADAPRCRPRPEEDARRRPQPGSGHPRSHAGQNLRRAHHLLPDVREALRDRRVPQDPPAARRRPAGDHRRRPHRHHQAARGREVQRRHPDGRRVGEALAGSPPHAAGLEPRERAGAGRGRRGGRAAHPSPAFEGAVLAAAGPAHRSRRHAALAGRPQEARRQVRHRAGLRRPVAVHRARRPGSDRGREVAALFRARAGQVRQDRLPDHPGRQRAAGELAIG